MKTKLISFFGFFIVCVLSSSAMSVANPDTNGLRSDTIDILNYTINLNITDFVTDTIRGNTVIRFTPKMNGINTLSLDLLHMTVDSIDINNSQLTFTYNDTLIIMNLPATKNIGDTTDVTVYYHGYPLNDPAGGGFYFIYPYAYNMGETFTFIPQACGRSWYPCFDNFRERALYTFNITTDSGKLAYCNGYLAKDTTIGPDRTRTWIMNHTLPSYLASVDVAPYIQVNDTFKGTDTIPIVIAAIKADSSKVSGTFGHLKNAIDIFQKCYGKYPWNKVGFTEVGPTGGSMEHATNIAYPDNEFSPAAEYLTAHELSHHWFGDEVTCWAASDMWLNEGFATYSQNIYAEYLHGEPSYWSSVKTNHSQVLQFADVYDSGYRSISGVPAQYTFSSTTYNKGADVLATLRGYLGDSNFFNGLKFYLTSHAYEPVTTDTLEKSLERYTGLNLTDFFNDWVYSPGFSQFSIDSMNVVAAGPNYNVTLYVRQKRYHAPAYYSNVPLLVTFKSTASGGYSSIIKASGQYSTFNFTLPFKPLFAGLNMNGAIMGEATETDTALITKTGSFSFTDAQIINVKVSSIADTAFMNVEHYLGAPDPLKDTSYHYRLSPNHYWRVSGIYPPGFKTTSAQLFYNGTKNTGSPSGYLDTTLTINTDDSIILLYRKNTSDDWREFPAYTKKKLSLNYGYFTLDSLPAGEYVIANGISHVLGINELKTSLVNITLYPNPASGNFNITLNAPADNEYLAVYDIQGKLIDQVSVNPGRRNYTFYTGKWASGAYNVNLRNTNKVIATKQVIISH